MSTNVRSPGEGSVARLSGGAHPLDGAIEYAGAFLLHPEVLRLGESADWLEAIGTNVIGARRSSVQALCQCAANCHNWLRCLGCEDPWALMRAEYDRARAKHGDCTLDGDGLTDTQRYCALLEEVGEIARALTYDRDHAGNLSEEIVQCGGLALAWLARETLEYRKTVERVEHSLDLAPIQQRLRAVAAETGYEQRDIGENVGQAWSDLYEHAPSDLHNLLAEVQRLRSITVS